MKILVTGVTGYVGGSVARKLVDVGHEVIGLHRDGQQAEKLNKLGIEPLLGSLADEELLVATCKSVDGVVNAADSDHGFAVTTMLPALSGTGKFFVHTSGSSIVADRACGEASDKVFHEDIPLNPIPEKAGRVFLDRHILAAALDHVRSVVLCPSLIYGSGSGLKTDSLQVPALIDYSRKTGAGRHIGRGLNIWSNVHIDDLTELYVLAVEKATAGSFFFVENGEESMKDVATAISNLIGAHGKTESISMADAIKQWGAGMAHYALASNSRLCADKARKMLNWNPKHRDLLSDIRTGSYASKELARALS